MINITIRNGLLYNAIRYNTIKHKPINSHVIHSQYGEFIDEVKSMPRGHLKYFASKLNERFKFYADSYCKYTITFQPKKAQQARQFGEAIYTTLIHINNYLKEPEKTM